MAYCAKVLDGNLQSTLCHVTARLRGGVLGPTDLCMKKGEWVVDVLDKKHPVICNLDLDSDNNLAFSKN